MAGRRPHRKSRLGCKRCKVRRMKCDETHPVCNNCSKHHLECDFTPSHEGISSIVLPKLPPVQIPALQASREDSSRPPSPTTSIVLRKKSRSGSTQSNDGSVEEISRSWPNSPVPASMDTPTDRLLDLRLMHHIMAMSSQTYFKLIGPGDKSVAFLNPPKKIYTNWTVRLALTSPYLMDALLGFAAFNLRNFDSSDTSLARASHAYMTRAISAHAEEIKKGLNDGNGSVMFATASLIAFTTISSAHFMSYNEDSALPLHWFRPWQGVRTIATAAWLHIHDQEIRGLLEHERTVQLPPESPADQPAMFEFLFEDLDRDSTESDTLLAYQNSVKWLSTLYYNPVSEYTFKFTTKVSPKFVKLLEQKDPRTLTIVGYFFMLLKILDQPWWLPHSTSKQFWALMSIIPDDWKPRMAWAVREFDKYDEMDSLIKSEGSLDAEGASSLI